MIGMEVVQRSLFELIEETHELLNEYQGLVKRTVELAIRIGKNLCEIRDSLQRGHFLDWVSDEFGLGQATAYKFIWLAEAEPKFTLNVSLPLYIRYELASPKIPQTVIEQVESGEIPATIPAIREAKRTFNPVQHGMGQSKVVAWNTPSAIVDEVEDMLGVIDVDPASNSKDEPNVPAITHYTEEDDGLSQLWEGRVFLNPPYGREIGEWIEKLVQEYRDGNIAEAIALVPARTDTQWFRALFNYPLCFISGRVRYSDGDGAAPFPSVLVYMGSRVDDFISVFKHRGPIMKRMSYEY
jgi:phage N-6-adenine-methyltransferase